MMSSSVSNEAVSEIDLPSLEKDPAERKRVLNVLAQRRYRRRKKEHVQSLERAKKLGHDTNCSNSTLPNELVGDDIANVTVNPVAAHDNSLALLDFSTYNDTDWSRFEVPTLSDDASWDANLCIDQAVLEGYNSCENLTLSSISASPSSSSSAKSAVYSQVTFVECSGLPRPPSSSEVSLSRDEIHLPVTELALLRGMVTIAKRLEIDHLIWDLHALSPFCNGGRAPLNAYEHLPSNLRPTAMQLSTPHHPAFDLLPWPAVRDRFIMVFSQPLDIRPPAARSPTAFVDFVYDLEDPAEGVRIYGDNPAEEANWEIGQKLFERWWWALNKEVISRANEWRDLRGAKLLEISSNS